MGLDGQAAKRQSKAGASPSACLAWYLAEAGEDLLPVLFRDAWPGIADVDY
jgi:hypothetical protein